MNFLKKKICIVLIIAVVAILAYGINYLKTPVNSQKAERITQEVFVEANAVFVRDEDVYYAPGSGYAYYSYAEGDRVKTGTRIANVYENTPSEENIKQLTTIDRKLKNSVYSSTNKIDANINQDAAEGTIDEYRRAIINSSYTNDISTAARYKAMINAVRAGENTVDYIETEESLELERDAVNAEIGGVKYDIFSERSGVFSTVLDGLEKVLTPQHIDRITIDEIKSVYNISSKSTEKNLKKNEVMFKIVNNHEWYVLVVVDNKDIEKYEAGKVVNLSFDNIPGELTEGKIMDIKEDTGQSIVFIRCQRYLEGAYSFRESKCKVIFDTYDGFKVPVYAIRVDGDKKSVVAIDNNRTDNYPVRVLYTDTEKGYAIVDSTSDSEKKLDSVDYIVVGER